MQVLFLHPAVTGANEEARRAFENPPDPYNPEYRLV
jgi:hypothetical protein